MGHASLQIKHLSFRYETFDLVRVDTEGARSVLLDRLEERRNGLGNFLAGQAREQNIEIVQRYSAILERIAVKPTSEKQLADLRDFIEDAKHTVVELQANVADIRQSLELLEFHRYPLTVEDMRLSWSTLEYPSKVETSSIQVEVALEADKVRMMDRLTLQKEQFEKVLESLGLQVKAAKQLDDYTDREKMAEQLNTLMDNINEAKAKGEEPCLVLAYLLSHVHILTSTHLPHINTLSHINTLLYQHTLTSTPPHLLTQTHPLPSISHVLLQVMISTCVKKYSALLPQNIPSWTNTPKNWHPFSNYGTWSVIFTIQVTTGSTETSKNWIVQKSMKM